MAEKTLTICDVDDRNGGAIEAVGRVHIDTTAGSYDVDLCQLHLDEVTAVVGAAAPPVRSARPGRRGGPRRRSSAAGSRATRAGSATRSKPRPGRGKSHRAAASGPSADLVRAWAQQQGIPVSDRGRLARSVVDQYVAATAGQA